MKWNVKRCILCTFPIDGLNHPVRFGVRGVARVCEACFIKLPAHEQEDSETYKAELGDRWKEKVRK